LNPRQPESQSGALPTVSLRSTSFPLSRKGEPINQIKT